MSGEHQILFAAMIVGSFIMQAHERREKAYDASFLWALVGYISFAGGWFL